MRLPQRLRQDGIGRGPAFSDNQPGFDPAAAQLKRCLNIAKICGKVTLRDPETGCHNFLVEGQADLLRGDGS